MENETIDELREKLHKAIENHGRDSPKVLKISKKLDKHIVDYIKNIEMKK